MDYFFLYFKSGIIKIMLLNNGFYLKCKIYLCELILRKVISMRDR